MHLYLYIGTAAVATAAAAAAAAAAHGENCISGYTLNWHLKVDQLSHTC